MGLARSHELDANLAYSFVSGPPGQRTLTIAATPPKGPAYSVMGTALVPRAAPVPFIATWWAETAQGAVRMRTEFPEIRFADATMTLTTPHCPVAESMPGEVELRVGSVPGVGLADVNLVWDPPWDPQKMSDEAKLELGML